MLTAVLLSGCGTSTPNCLANGIRVSPTSASADHAALAPGNQARFYADPVPVPGCAYPQVIGSVRDAVWSTSDPASATISNQNDDTYGVATCIQAAVSLTVKTTTPDGSLATATLTCR